MSTLFRTIRPLLRCVKPSLVTLRNTRLYSTRIDQLVRDNKVTVFSKTTCPFCLRVKKLFQDINQPIRPIELDQIHDGHILQEELSAKTGRATVPQVFIRGSFIGGCDDTMDAYDSGKLQTLLKDHDYDYDLIVIGGGSGGLAASKEAAKLGKKVALFDYVKPSPIGTTWGLGGTCVNVGCIPKKLMHQAALYGEHFHDSHPYGWKAPDGNDLRSVAHHDWPALVERVQSHIKMANFNYRNNMRDQKVQYINAFATFTDKHSISATDKKGKTQTYTAANFIIAPGERPRYPSDVAGALEYGITSDDIFSLPHPPGKTVVVGASYVGLECAGFLRGLGFDVTLLARSILLRGFDQDMAERVGKGLQDIGVNIIRPALPHKIEQVESGKPSKLKIHVKDTNSGEEILLDCNTVLFAIGREPYTKGIGLETVGVDVNQKNGKIIVDEEERTSVPHIYAVGDVAQGRPELTPVAIEAGRLLSKRIFAGSTRLCDYDNIPTTVFTPTEYGCVGLSEEKASRVYGADNIEVYHQGFRPFEWGLTERDPNVGFLKVITKRSSQPEEEDVLGIHFVGPNAGEVIQFASLAIKKGITKGDLDHMIGIHPTSAEMFNSLRLTKRSGEDPNQAANCCG